MPKASIAAIGRETVPSCCSEMTPFGQSRPDCVYPTEGCPAGMMRAAASFSRRQLLVSRACCGDRSAMRRWRPTTVRRSCRVGVCAARCKDARGAPRNAMGPESSQPQAPMPGAFFDAPERNAVHGQGAYCLIESRICATGDLENAERGGKHASATCVATMCYGLPYHLCGSAALTAVHTNAPE